MNRRDLLLGGGLAVALAAGILLTRGSDAGDGPPVGLDLTHSDGRLDVNGIAVEVTAGPRPLRVFDRLRFSFGFSRDGEAIAVTQPRIDFNMVMDMGPHAWRLVRDQAGPWVAEDVVLPQCGSGSRLWFGDLTFEAEGQPRAARLQVELHPPGTD